MPSKKSYSYLTLCTFVHRKRKVDRDDTQFVSEKEKERRRKLPAVRIQIALLSAGLPLYRAPMLLARRRIRRGLFCRFDTVSPWRQLKGYRVSYDRRRRLSPAAGIIKLKSYCAAALRGRAAINHPPFIVQRNVTG